MAVAGGDRPAPRSRPGAAHRRGRAAACVNTGPRRRPCPRRLPEVARRRSPGRRRPRRGRGKEPPPPLLGASRGGRRQTPSLRPATPGKGGGRPAPRQAPSPRKVFLDLVAADPGGIRGPGRAGGSGRASPQPRGGGGLVPPPCGSWSGPGGHPPVPGV